MGPIHPHVGCAFMCSGCDRLRGAAHERAPSSCFDYLAKFITGVTVKDGIETINHSQIAA